MLVKDALELTKACILFFRAVPEVQVAVAPGPKDDAGEVLCGYYVTPEAWTCNPVLSMISQVRAKS